MIELLELVGCLVASIAPLYIACWIWQARTRKARA